MRPPPSSVVVACWVLLGALLVAGTAASSHALNVQGAQVVEQLTKLATFTDDPNPYVTRVLFTLTDVAARGYVKELMEAAGLAVREDKAGNIFGRWAGAQEEAVLTGSHCDAIPLAGMYDGTLGVIGAIEAIAALRRSGFQPSRSLEVMMFTSEEPTRFGLSCAGSRAMAGVLDAGVLQGRPDENGTLFLEAAAAAGYGAGSHQEILDDVLVPAGRYSHFVELHIEQGPLLEQEGLDIGIVTSIAAPAALTIEFWGDGGHAGALLMHARNDAALAAAQVALALEHIVLATQSQDTVGTVGIFEIKPNAINSVPRYAKLGIDIRDIDEQRRDSVVRQVMQVAEETAAKRKVRLEARIVNQDPPATCSGDITAAIQESARALGLHTKRMVSRAYHDALFMARIVPTSMIFIPCKDGVSHRPDEFASAKDIEQGVQVLALTLAELAGGKWSGEEGREEL